MKRLVLLLSVLSLLCACVTLKFEAPKVSVVGVSLVSGDAFSQQFRIRLHVKNPNRLELPIKSLEYKLYLQGDYIAEGITDQSFVVPALGEAEFDTNIRTNLISGIARLLGNLVGTDNRSIKYALVGTVKLNKGLFTQFSFNEEGNVGLNVLK